MGTSLYNEEKNKMLHIRMEYVINIIHTFVVCSFSQLNVNKPFVSSQIFHY